MRGSISVEDLGVGTLECHLVQGGNEAGLIPATVARLRSSWWRCSAVGVRKGAKTVGGTHMVPGGLTAPLRLLSALRGEADPGAGWLGRGRHLEGEWGVAVA